MSRPILEAIDRTDTDWLTKLNSNFEKLLDAPLPGVSATDLTTLTSTYNPKLYNGCWAIVEGFLYQSDGTDWVPRQLDYVADLDTVTVVLSDVVTAHNNLLADMQSKGFMA